MLPTFSLPPYPQTSEPVRHQPPVPSPTPKASGHMNWQPVETAPENKWVVVGADGIHWGLIAKLRDGEWVFPSFEPNREIMFEPKYWTKFTPPNPSRPKSK